MIEAIIFDLDGTIIDSELAALQAIVECTGEWGVSVTREQAATVAGKKWEVAFDLLYSQHKIPLAKEEASRLIVERFQQIVRKELRVVPGVVSAVKSFAPRYRLSLVSGSHREDVLWAVRKLGIEKYFEHILGAEDYPGSKPSPDGFNKAIALMGVAPSRTLVFEDSHAGIASALAAGCIPIAITSTNHFGHDQSGARHHIPHFEGVGAEWVEKHFPTA